MKITVVGAGNVGATCTAVLAQQDAAYGYIFISLLIR